MIERLVISPTEERGQVAIELQGALAAVLNLVHGS